MLVFAHHLVLLKRRHLLVGSATVIGDYLFSFTSLWMEGACDGSEHVSLKYAIMMLSFDSQGLGFISIHSEDMAICYVRKIVLYVFN